jgi:hypothetical protein
MQVISSEAGRQGRGRGAHFRGCGWLRSSSRFAGEAAVAARRGQIGSRWRARAAGAGIIGRMTVVNINSQQFAGRSCWSEPLPPLPRLGPTPSRGEHFSGPGSPPGMPQAPLQLSESRACDGLARIEPRERPGQSCGSVVQSHDHGHAGLGGHAVRGGGHQAEHVRPGRGGGGHGDDTGRGSEAEPRRQGRGQYPIDFLGHDGERHAEMR